MDWDLYKSLEREEEALCREAPVSVEVERSEYHSYARAMMLLRRIMGNNTDLREVDLVLSELLGKINDAFRAVPGTEALRASRMAMLQERRKP